MRTDSLRMDQTNYPIRYVVTHVAQTGTMKGVRVMTGACQGRNTYDTLKQAQAWIESARKNNSASTMAMFGTPDTLEPRPVQCYPGHHDPVGIYFDLEEGA